MWRAAGPWLATIACWVTGLPVWSLHAWSATARVAMRSAETTVAGTRSTSDARRCVGNTNEPPVDEAALAGADVPVGGGGSVRGDPGRGWHLVDGEVGNHRAARPW